MLDIEHFDLCTYEVDMTRDKVQVLRIRLHYGAMRINAVHQTFVDRFVQFANLHTQTGRRVRLGVRIDEQHALT